MDNFNNQLSQEGIFSKINIEKKKELIKKEKISRKENWFKKLWINIMLWYRVFKQNCKKYYFWSLQFNCFLEFMCVSLVYLFACLSR